jgi:hypothetical protein
LCTQIVVLALGGGLIPVACESLAITLGTDLVLSPRQNAARKVKRGEIRLTRAEPGVENPSMRLAYPTHATDQASEVVRARAGRMAVESGHNLCKSALYASIDAGRELQMVG